MKYVMILSISVVSLLSCISDGVSSVIFTEVFYDTPGVDDKEEWVELYNPTSKELDIGGYVIQDNSRSYTIASGTMIKAGQTLVFARDREGFHKLYGFYPDFGNLNLQLNNNGDFLKLMKGGTILDMVAWEGGYKDSHPEWSDIKADEDESIQRWSLSSGPGAWLSNREPNPGDPAPIPEPGTMLIVGIGAFVVVKSLILGKSGRTVKSGKS